MTNEKLPLNFRPFVSEEDNEENRLTSVSSIDLIHKNYMIPYKNFLLQACIMGKVAIKMEEVNTVLTFTLEGKPNNVIQVTNMILAWHHGAVIVGTHL